MKVLTVYQHPNPPSFCHAVLQDHRPKDVGGQWGKVENAGGVAFTAPVFWQHRPAILKDWFKRVLGYGDAIALTTEGWRRIAESSRSAECECAAVDH